MFLFDWFRNLFSGNNQVPLDATTGELSIEYFFKELALGAAINIIGTCVSKSEFMTYFGSKPEIKKNHYLFNVEPNPNQAAAEFWMQVVNKMIREKSCLVVQNNGHFYIADSFTLDERQAFNPNRYRDVKIFDLKLDKTFTESEVLHFKLHSAQVAEVVTAVNASYSKLISAAQNKYKRKNAHRGTIEIPTSYPKTEQATKDLEDLLNRRFSRFFSAENGAVLPLTNGIKYNDLNGDLNKGASTDGRDIRAFVDDIFDFVANGLNISPQLLKGSAIDLSGAIQAALTFCIPQYTQEIECEINRKLYGLENYTSRNFLKIDTSRIKATELKEVANALDILFRIGAHDINDHERVLGKELTNEEWARERYVTKNYEKIKKGGTHIE